MGSNVSNTRTIREAQAVLCQLCRQSSVLKWKCVDCAILMCNLCKENVHAKVKGATRHTIVDIKDIEFSGKTDGPSVDLDNIPCKTHPKQMCCVYCRECKQLICSKCLIKDHNGHDMDEIETVYKENLEKFRKLGIKDDASQALSVIFGSFEGLNIGSVSTEITFDVKQTFETNLPFVHSLVIKQDETLWISCFEFFAMLK